MPKNLFHNALLANILYLVAYNHLTHNKIHQIQSKGFSFSDLRLSLDYNAVTNLLMGEHIYGDRKYGLRELIQNYFCSLLSYSIFIGKAYVLAVSFK